MKTIYKSIALEAALLSVTLALQAEIQSEGETVTADVQASTLDRLRVTLVSPSVSGARDLVAAGNATIDGNEIAVNLENLAFGTHRLVVSARFGTQIRTLYALDISVPQSELPNETQEYEDAAIVVSTYGDGGGGGEFPTDYAKQGDDPTATLTDTQAYAQAAAEAAQSLTSLDSDINAGKTAIAQAVTAKGVQTSPTDTMLQMATNVKQIAQAPISINGGEMYAKQLYGSLTTPNYWNLHEVMAQLLSDGRLNNYGGILLAEYYKGYDSIALSGAGAGGAYVVSDVDNNGNFILYTEDTTHVWDTKDDGKGNRWVAYLFAAENHNFDITDTNTCPRSIFIGRNVGIITSLVTGRVSKIVVFGDGKLQGFNSNDLNQEWDKSVVVQNIDGMFSLFETGTYRVECLYVSGRSLSSSTIYKSAVYNSRLSTFILKADTISNLHCINIASEIKYIFIQADTITNVYIIATGEKTVPYVVVKTEEYNQSSNLFIYQTTIQRLRFEYITNDKTRSINIPRLNGSASAKSMPELQEGWCKSITLNVFTYMTEDWICQNILQRLKQDEADCGDGVTITLGQTNLDKLTSQESIDLLDALTNTYGYTFA